MSCFPERGVLQMDKIWNDWRIVLSVVLQLGPAWGSCAGMYVFGWLEAWCGGGLLRYLVILVTGRIKLCSCV